MDACELLNESRCTYKDRPGSNDYDDRHQSAQEQQAHGDVHVPYVSSNEVVESFVAANDEAHSQHNEDEQDEKLDVVAEELTSFPAIQATENAVMPLSISLVVSTSELLTAHEVQSEPLGDEKSGRLRARRTGKKLLTLDVGVEDEEDDVSDTTFQNMVLESSDELTTKTDDREPKEEELDESEFAVMLQHLSRGKLASLALLVDDLTINKLKRIHTALSNARQSRQSMAYVRTLVSLDMLQLLLRRLGEQAIHDAVSRTLYYIQDRDKVESGLDAPAFLTSGNIATVVLKVRQDFTSKVSVVSSPGSQVRLSSPVTNRSSRALSFSSSSVASSPRRGSLRSPGADRRSILASDGAHVLMQERIMAFDFRGQTNMLSTFRVRGASPTLTDAAARRRERGLRYANEHVSHRTMQCE